MTTPTEVNSIRPTGGTRDSSKSALAGTDDCLLGELELRARREGISMARAIDVFVPTSTPSVTYIDRSHLGFEDRLRQSMQIPNMVVSVSGPSKSGKSVLIRKVISEDNLISVSGSAIKSADDLWEHALSWMGTPSKIVTSTSVDARTSLSGGATGSVGLPLVASGSVKADISGSLGRISSEAREERLGGLRQIVREIGNSDFVLFIDDFHYIPDDIQAEIGRQIKSAAESGVKIVTASVPHRSDDVVRSNPELRGRVSAIDLGYWDEDDLRLIANRGFKELNIDVAPRVETNLAREAFGSPQLMQLICLNLCFQLSATITLGTHERVEITDETMRRVLERASAFSDYSTLTDVLHAGPKQRGSERKIHSFIDQSKGDVYRAVLLAIKADPPKLSLRYDEMLERVRATCTDTTPAGSSISEALMQMDKLTVETSANTRILEWDSDVLDIVEPYFLYFLRWSIRLQALAKPQ